MTKKVWIIGGGIVAALALVAGGIWLGFTGQVGVCGRGIPGGWRMMGGYGFPMMGGWWGGLGMMLLWAVAIAGLLWLGLAASSRRGHTAAPPAASETPLDILKRRYAAGEINKEQFDEMRRNLE